MDLRVHGLNDLRLIDTPLEEKAVFELSTYNLGVYSFKFSERNRLFTREKVVFELLTYNPGVHSISSVRVIDTFQKSKLCLSY